MYILRDYQRKQKNFLENNIGDIENYFSPLFDKNISIESPTGSGKSITMLSFIKDVFEKTNDTTKIFISTGFNKLVYQIEKEAKEMGIPTKILIGKSHANCIKNIDNDFPETDKFLTYLDDERNKFSYKDGNIKSSFKVFEENSNYKCNYSKCVNCKNRYDSNCIYNQLIEDITYDSGNMLVITNHSTLLYNDQLFSKNFRGGFIDECQTFADFYESYISTEVTPGQLYMLLKDVKENQLKISDNKGLINFIEHGLKNGQLSKKMLSAFLDIELKGKDKKGSQLTVRTKHSNISKGIQSWIDTDNEDNNYIHPLFEDGKFKGIKIDRFFTSIDVFPYGSVCLVSATVDEYTKNLFSVNKSYEENGCVIFDYSKSNFYVYPSFDNKNLESFIKEQEGDKGLLLSTRLSIVNQAKESKNIGDYEFVFSSDDFVEGKKQILCGSKSMFQGIDIPNIDFVIINKIPFPRFDESYKKKQVYIQKVTNKNSFENYTIPYTENQLIQAMGRLWRKPGDIGNVAVFDDKLINKHNNILKYIVSYRDGITLKNKVYFK